MKNIITIYILFCIVLTALYGGNSTKTEIPCIVYGLGPVKDANFKLARNLGFNTVHSYTRKKESEKTINHDRLFLKLAQQNNMKVMFNLNGSEWLKKDDKGKAFRKYIRKFKNDPAISMWYLYDEPRLKTIPGLRKLYRILKDETPDIPVAIAMNWTVDFMRYGDIYDIILPDVYPVVDQKFPNAPLYQLADFTASLQTLGKPVYPVVQFFNWEIYPLEAKKRAVNNPNECRYPNAAELRYWMYMSAIQKCEGIAFFSFARSVIQDAKNALPWAEKTFGPILREYMKWRGAGFVRHQELTRFRDSKLRGAVCKIGNTEYLVMVNDWPLEQSVKSRYMEELVGNAELEAYGATRPVKAKIINGQLSIQEKILPWETFVWKLKRQAKEN